MSLRLPNECVQNILGHLSESDHKTLLSLALVNRNFCQNAIPLLWKNPLHSRRSSRKHYKIIPLLLSSLDEDRKSLLKFTERKLVIPKTTIFYYTAFIKKLDFMNLLVQVFYWYKRNCKTVKPEKKNKFRKFLLKSRRWIGTCLRGSNKSVTLLEKQEILIFSESIFDSLFKHHKFTEFQIYPSHPSTYLPHFPPIKIKTGFFVSPHTHRTHNNPIPFNKFNAFNLLVKYASGLGCYYIDTYSKYRGKEPLLGNSIRYWVGNQYDLIFEGGNFESGNKDILKVFEKIHVQCWDIQQVKLILIFDS
ncbi:22854_t:CDS:1 [Dentiscutata erythropus]|uniref:22854_t:CDS:1 n=1 Tax=Dentiscutata erythropus TaxID=1348616 RepID=A0A9N9CFC7_9GLOM|nr:22854_t:CDS:1 [Dentiscutata erythropus]